MGGASFVGIIVVIAAIRCWCDSNKLNEIVKATFCTCHTSFRVGAVTKILLLRGQYGHDFL